MSAAEPPEDVRASGAKPRPEGADRERGREADATALRTTNPSKEAEANRAPSGGSAAAKPQAWGDHPSAQGRAGANAETPGT